MKPCMIVCIKNETDSAQELWNDMHTLKKLASLSKNWKKTIFATETTTCDP